MTNRVLSPSTHHFHLYMFEQSCCRRRQGASIPSSCPGQTSSEMDSNRSMSWRGPGRSTLRYPVSQGCVRASKRTVVNGDKRSIIRRAPLQLVLKRLFISFNRVLLLLLVLSLRSLAYRARRDLGKCIRSCQGGSVTSPIMSWTLIDSLARSATGWGRPRSSRLRHPSTMAMTMPSRGGPERSSPRQADTSSQEIIPTSPLKPTLLPPTRLQSKTHWTKFFSVSFDLFPLFFTDGLQPREVL